MKEKLIGEYRDNPSIRYFALTHQSRSLPLGTSPAFIGNFLPCAYRLFFAYVCDWGLILRQRRI